MGDIIKLIEEGGIKRYFRARDKLCFEGAVAHITQHASGTEPLFLEESDYLYMIHLIKETSHKFSLTIYSFGLMLNHIHLLAIFKENNMSIAMKNLFERYAIYFNKKYSRKGHVFCGAFRCALCFDENYLIAASLYIHFNPVRARLVGSAINYRWSSCALFLKEIEKESFVNYKPVLQLLDLDMSKARAKYASLLEKLKSKQISDILEKPRGLKYLAQIVKENNEECIKDHFLLEDVIEKQIEQLKTKKRLHSPKAKQARTFLIEQLKARGFTVAEIAEKLNVTCKVIYDAQAKPFKSP